MAVSDFHEKRQNRAERYQELAEKNNELSKAKFNQSQDLVKHIPMGQPILVGHHSEKRHRNQLDKSWNALGASVKAGEKSQYYAEKAAKLNSEPTAISSDDPEAIVKLKEKIERLETLQNTMKAANKICRNKKLSKEEKVKELAKLSISETQAESLFNPVYSFEKPGFPSYKLTNNNAKLKNAKKRLEQLQKQATMENTEYQVKDIRVVDDVEDNRLRLYFDDKPEQEIRTKLKQSGFRYSPKFECWQAYRSAKYKMETFLQWYKENY